MNLFRVHETKCYESYFRVCCVTIHICSITYIHSGASVTVSRVVHCMYGIGVWYVRMYLTVYILYFKSLILLHHMHI